MKICVIVDLGPDGASVLGATVSRYTAVKMAFENVMGRQYDVLDTTKLNSLVMKLRKEGSVSLERASRLAAEKGANALVLVAETSVAVTRADIVDLVESATA